MILCLPIARNLRNQPYHLKNLHRLARIHAKNHIYEKTKVLLIYYSCIFIVFVTILYVVLFIILYFQLLYSFIAFVAYDHKS